MLIGTTRAALDPYTTAIFRLCELAVTATLGGIEGRDDHEAIFASLRSHSHSQRHIVSTEKAFELDLPSRSVKEIRHKRIATVIKPEAVA
ncbi:MAG: hypothetical protein KC609_08290 [Myxococcales bacterium]|nr:hypothetical protein [Myxococcales bacterium]